MKYGRSSHAVCFCSNYIFVIGGTTGRSDQLQITATCEAYEIMCDKWHQIANLNTPAVSCSVTPFNENYIFKFGGLSEGLKTNNNIEKLTISENKWELICARYDPDSSQAYLQNFRLLDSSCAIQISDYEIFVFGG